MSEGLFSAVELGGATRAGYRLHSLEVLNWGTFDRHIWRLTAAGETALLTGDIGSGKSTLVDALTTLLMPAHRIAYNKAAGADARERTLRSYVEGHYKSERIESTGRSRAKGLREGRRTYSVIVGVFVNDGYGETVTLAEVFQQRDTAGQPYRFYVTADKQLSIASDFAEFGTDLRDLRRRLRDAGCEVFDEFPKYGTALRRLLGIRSDQALDLFHQTVSMKSVGNLNDFVRDHMLEPSDPAERIRAIIAHFEDLTKAYDAVKRAREQLEALEPIAATAAKYDAATAERDAAGREADAVEVFVAELRAGLLAKRIAELTALGGQLWAAQDAARAAQKVLAGERDSLIEARAQAGGDRIGELERLARDAREQATRRADTRARFDSAVAGAGFEPVVDRDGFGALTATIAAARLAGVPEKQRLDAALVDAISREKDLQRDCDRVAAEIDSLQRRTSNLPVEQVELRARMCADLKLDPDEIPYAGELLDVVEDRAEWRGAAERVLRPFALSLLVPQHHYEAVARWVNERRLTVSGAGGASVGARLTYQRVAARQIALQPERHEGLVLADCMVIKEGPFADYLAGELRSRADHRCAASLAEFRRERRAVTREGQVRSADRHDKDDRHPVDDPRRWALGWVNERKIAALVETHADLDGRRRVASDELAQVTAERDGLQSRQESLARLEEFRTWAELDVAEASARAADHEAERARLQAGSSRLAAITEALQRNTEKADALSAEIDELAGRLATAAAEEKQATRAKNRDDALVSELTPTDLAVARESYDALRARLGSALPHDPGECGDAQLRLSGDLHKRTERLTRELGGYAQSLGLRMADFLSRWPELRADMDASPESRGDFVAFRDRVANDDLPRFETEFKEQLNKNAIQELAGFNNWLGRQASAIDERVGKINEALGAVPYNPGRYIRLEKEPTTNQDIVQFRADLRNLTNDSLAVDGDQYSEQRFLDVKRIIERFSGRAGFADIDKAWTRRVNDVRNWFVFSASERDAETDAEWEHYSDSDGKSGGQKEKLAYTILAASLAYQFGLEWGAEKSRDFRFAVIDEAFGRGSDVSTRYALELFAKLGLQLLIVTPLQKVHVIEPYVKAIGFVDNPAGTSSQLHTMTIEEYRTRRDGPRP